MVGQGCTQADINGEVRNKTYTRHGSRILIKLIHEIFLTHYTKETIFVQQLMYCLNLLCLDHHKPVINLGNFFYQAEKIISLYFRK